MRFAAIVAVTFCVMEFVSYLAHRYIYHGFLWVFHKSHHSRREGIFEWNDVFPVFFSTIAIGLMYRGATDPGGADLLAAAIGVSAYGIVYFFIHDLYVHRRARWMRLRIPFLRRLKQAHAIHHREGGEPYGLLLFSNREKVAREKVDEDDVV
jgi:beta-carotene 3-hydroxylase